MPFLNRRHSNLDALAKLIRSGAIRMSDLRLNVLTRLVFWPKGRTDAEENEEIAYCKGLFANELTERKW